MTERVERGMAAVLIVDMMTSGCGTMVPRYMGIPPDAVDIQLSTSKKKWCEQRHASNPALATACREHEGYVEWANQLLESYKTRATMNEWAISVAGPIALGALSAIGGLGNAAAATKTIGLIGVSSGFAAGFFGLLNNSERAALYAEAANEIQRALAEATTKTATPPTAVSEYGGAVAALSSCIHKASISVETGRYRLASAAAASQEQQRSKDEVAEFQRLASGGPWST